MTAKIVFKDLKDKEFFDLVDLKTPIFVEFINIDTVKSIIDNSPISLLPIIL